MAQHTKHFYDFVKDAQIFVDEHRSNFIFRVLKFYTKSNEYELDYLIKKIYCLSIPTSQYVKESFIKTFIGLIFLPFFYLFRKKWLWKKEKISDFNFETVDRDYFFGRFSTTYELLPGTKRITPRDNCIIVKDETTSSISSTVDIRSIILLIFLIPIVIIPLYVFIFKHQINIIRAYRSAITTYTRYHGYFRRYPCRNFITYEDHSNDPSRYVAFKQNCDGKLFVIQNGERSYHPSWSCGMVDIYFVFGETYSKMMGQLGYHIGQVIPVGSVALNQWYRELNEGPTEKLYDILYIDNGSICPPDYGGLKEEVAKTEERIFAHLNQFKLGHRQCRIAFQLRNYTFVPSQKENILSVLKKHFGENIDILDNTGQGESYENIKRSNLIVVFNSTMGFESFMLGKKALFVNYSGYTDLTLCEDGIFQIEGNDASYELFEKKVEYLLDLELPKIPEFAVERHYAFDGKVQQRIAQKIKELMGR